jgi:hypothetical protein
MECLPLFQALDPFKIPSKYNVILYIVGILLGRLHVPAAVYLPLPQCRRRPVAVAMSQICCSCGRPRFVVALSPHGHHCRSRVGLSPVKGRVVAGPGRRHIVTRSGSLRHQVEVGSLLRCHQVVSGSGRHLSGSCRRHVGATSLPLRRRHHRRWPTLVVCARATT